VHPKHPELLTAVMERGTHKVVGHYEVRAPAGCSDPDEMWRRDTEMLTAAMTSAMAAVFNTAAASAASGSAEGDDAIDTHDE
jgi:hypothetical protein